MDTWCHDVNCCFFRLLKIVRCYFPTASVCGSFARHSLRLFPVYPKLHRGRLGRSKSAVCVDECHRVWGVRCYVISSTKIQGLLLLSQWLYYPSSPDYGGKCQCKSGWVRLRRGPPSSRGAFICPVVWNNRLTAASISILASFTASVYLLPFLLKSMRLRRETYKISSYSNFD